MTFIFPGSLTSEALFLHKITAWGLAHWGMTSRELSNIHTNMECLLGAEHTALSEMDKHLPLLSVL